MQPSIQQYCIITGNYWVFTLTDGALRMLVVLYFYQLGYEPIEIASLFLFYEFFGIITNLVGGWLGTQLGLNRTMHIGLVLQITSLLLLLAPNNYLTVMWVMLAQALSGIAKDLNKMSAKSALKNLAPHKACQSNQAHLYKWVSLLTGSKNTLKGIGFFMGGALLSSLGFRGALVTMIILLITALVVSVIYLNNDLGKTKNKPKFKHIFAKSAQINYLSAARFFLFASRDVWFVIAAPLTLSAQFNWPHTQVGSFFALWVIGYGIVQAFTPSILKQKQKPANEKSSLIWITLLLITTTTIAISQYIFPTYISLLVIGFMIFGIVFALNSAIHSYLIVSYANTENTSLDVGFYYMANAAGRLTGTILSGLLYQQGGLLFCLIASSAFLIIGCAITSQLHNIIKKS
ncbi:MAG: organoarsenical effux MFS transporter ArsJ [Gammaproteobacteria bacterium]|nr:organoarsenical effux MFS transporter ArsJ [Gammaproteobacteria bacterium]